MGQLDPTTGDFKYRLPDPKLCIVAADGRPMVTIDLVTRSIEFGPGYDPDAVAREFWATIAGWRGVAAR